MSNASGQSEEKFNVPCESGRPTNTPVERITHKSGKRRRSRRDVFYRNRADLLFVHERKETAASMENVLTQALASNDKQLLDSVLKIEDLLVVRRTISEMAPHQIEQFIHQIVARFYETPLRMRVLGPWLRELLRQRISSCISVPTIRQGLTKLYLHACARLRYHHNAVKLQGQLDSLTYLAYRRIEDSQLQQHDEDSEKPLVVFKESVDAFSKPESIAEAFHNYKQKQYHLAETEIGNACSDVSSGHNSVSPI